jgi:hypothetical protein
MSEEAFDAFDDEWGPGEDGFEWGEYQWRNYLNDSERDTARFLSIYNSVKEKPNHLDEAAKLMGWDVEDIALTNDSDDENNTDTDEDLDSIEPYTLHKHPVFVVSHALCRYLQQSWEQLIRNDVLQVDAVLHWRYAKSLHSGEMNAIMAIQALDLGDYGLVVCHFKNALNGVNQTLGLLDEILTDETGPLQNFKNEMRIRLFDLRELWLRVMGDCRAEVQRRGESPEGN